MIVGDRVRLVHTNDEYTSLRPGDQGKVTGIHPDPFNLGHQVIDVDWDNGSNLSMLTAANDRLEVVS